jgi:hypothetical protein
MVYQGMEPSNAPTRVLTRLTKSVNVIGVLVSEARMAREIVVYLSAAMEGAFRHPLPWI